MSCNLNSIIARTCFQTVAAIEPFLLHNAAQRGDEWAVINYLQNGLKPDILDMYEETALFRAVRSDHSKCTDALLRYGADVNARDSDGITPIYHAAAHDQKEQLRLLLSAGSDLYGDKGNTIFHFTYFSDRISIIKHGHSEIIPPSFKESLISLIELCVQHHPIFKETHSKTIKARTVSPKTVTAAKKAFDLLNAKNAIGDTPIHDAIQSIEILKSRDLVKALYRAGANLTIKNAKGQTAEDLLKEKGLLEEVTGLPS